MYPHLVIGLSLLYLGYLNQANGQYHRNSAQCLQKNGQPGKCRLIAECNELANLDVATLCTNSRLGPVVCCPLRDRRTNRPTNYFQSNPSNPWLSPNDRHRPRPPPQQQQQQPFYWPDNGSNRPNERIRQPSISQKKCREFYPPNVEASDFHITVVGGERTRPGEFPFMAALGWKGTSESYDYNCGGALISVDFVVTAAHCASARGQRPTVVKLGGDNIKDTNQGQQVAIKRIFVHPNYRNNQAYNDIALIQLRNAVTVTPACIWPTFGILQQQATAIGYGHTSFGGQRSDNLLKVTLKIVSNQACSSHYPAGSQIERGLQTSQLCAGDPNQKMDTCQGDSGGPILINSNENGTTIPYLIGVTSFGQGCAGVAPSIYTRISSYVDWIESIVWARQPSINDRLTFVK